MTPGNNIENRRRNYGHLMTTLDLVHLQLRKCKRKINTVFLSQGDYFFNAFQTGNFTRWVFGVNFYSDFGASIWHVTSKRDDCSRKYCILFSRWAAILWSVQQIQFNRSAESLVIEQWLQGILSFQFSRQVCLTTTRNLRRDNGIINSVFPLGYSPKI